MITKNGKNIAATVIMSVGTTNKKAYIPFTNIDGTQVYGAAKYGQAFPYSVGHNVVFNRTSNGVVVGSGDTAATENDYDLETQITAGLTAGNSTVNITTDNAGKIALEINATLSNTTESDIVIREIGLIQGIIATTTLGGNAGSTIRYVLLDRTVPATPITVPANGNVTLEYSIKVAV